VTARLSLTRSSTARASRMRSRHCLGFPDSGYRDGHVFVQDLKEMLYNLDLAIPKIGSVATGIGGIGAAAISGSAELFALSASLASIGPAALALPGIFGGFAIGLIATGVVLKDFNSSSRSCASASVGSSRRVPGGRQLQDRCRATSGRLLSSRFRTWSTRCSRSSKMDC
jgi:hypothetical protein